MSISIVIPVFNEEENIEGIIDELKQTLPEAEIIIVDDKSTDKSLEVAKKTGVKVMAHDFNLGYGAAIKTGIKKARNKTIGIIDADATYSPKDFLKLLKYADEYDMVVGAREKSGIPVIRKPAKWFLNKLANYLSDRKIPDLNSGLRIFRRGAALRFFNILPSGFSFTTTLTLAMLSNNYSIKYISISYYKRKGKSKIRPIHDTWNFIQLIIRTILYFNPLKVFLPISLFLFLLGLFILFYSYFFTPKLMDISTVIIIMTSIQVAVIGLLADLINKKIQR